MYCYSNAIHASNYTVIDGLALSSAAVFFFTSELFHAFYKLADSFLSILRFYNGSDRDSWYKLFGGAYRLRDIAAFGC